MMVSELLEIQPEEVRFIFELKKQSTCSLRLVNKSNNHVAFKVKTTAPKKYSVRPMSGIIKLKSTRDFVVTMQAELVPPPDIICKDKFLLLSTVVPVGTTDEDITSGMFIKEDGKYIEEKRLRVVLVSQPLSPVLSSQNGTSNQAPVYGTSTVKDEVFSRVENLSPNYMDTVDEGESKMEKVEPVKVVEVKKAKDVEELNLVKDIEEMKSKLNELELKLSEAEVTISNLTEERRLNTQEREIIRRELIQLSSSKRGVKRVEVGFPLLFVCMVALVNVIFGYFFAQVK